MTSVGVTLVIDGVLTGTTENGSALDVPLVGSWIVTGNVPSVATLPGDSCPCT